MDLRINAIRYKNIREFQDLKINLTKSNGSPHHISLIQMPNGTGKTTTMELIRTVLLGPKLEENTVSSFEPEEFDAIEGSFEADFESNGDQFTFRLELDYDSYDFQYHTIRPSEVGGGDMLGHAPPNQLKTVINESFVDLFVFNGELTQEFIETGSDEAEKALKIVNYLNRVEDQRNKIDQEVEERQDEESVTKESGFKNIKGRLNSTEEKLRELEEKEETLESDIARHESKIESLSSERSELLAENKEQYELDKRLDREMQQLRTEIENSTNTLFNRMQNPSQLHSDFNEDLEVLYEKMDYMELPKSTSQEFFIELSKRPECICGRDIDDDQSDLILENSKKYLSEDDIEVLNLLKGTLNDIPDFEDYQDEFDDLDEKREELEQAKQEKGRIDLEDPDMNQRLQDITEKKEEHKRKKEEKSEELRKLRSTDKNEREEEGLDWRENVHLCRQKVEERREKVRKASDTVNFGKKADILKEIFDDFIDEYLSTLKRKQINETNERLKQILGLSQVQIEDIDSSIKIRGKDDISEGQSLSIAYAYLSTLFEDSAIDVPFVIDSPAVSIDYEKRAEVAPIISDLFDQLVIFVISPERERFVNELDSDDIKYCTVHKTEQPGKVEKNLDKEYFMDFQSELAEEEIQEVA